MPVPVIIHKQPLTREEKTGLRERLTQYKNKPYTILAIPVFDSLPIKAVMNPSEKVEMQYRYFRIYRYIYNKKYHSVAVEINKKEI